MNQYDESYCNLTCNNGLFCIYLSLILQEICKHVRLHQDIQVI